MVARIFTRGYRCVTTCVVVCCLGCSVATGVELLPDPGFEDPIEIDEPDSFWNWVFGNLPIPTVNDSTDPLTGSEHASITFDSNQLFTAFGPTIRSTAFAGFGAAKNISDFTGLSLQLTTNYRVADFDMISPDPGADPALLIRTYAAYFNDQAGFLGLGGIDPPDFPSDVFSFGVEDEYTEVSYELVVPNFGIPVTSVDYTLGLIAPTTDNGDMTGTATVYFDDVSLSTMGDVDGDFNMDGLWNCDDINDLTGAIATGSNDLSFDMNNDGVLTLADVTDPAVGWLAIGGANNPDDTGGNAFLSGDVDLDGTVDGLDFIAWNENKFTANSQWCGGDLNADGTIDGLDFILWNDNKFMSSDDFAVVPEPSSCGWIMAIIALVIERRHRPFG